MGRRRNDESPLFDALYGLLKLTPPWVGPTLAVFAFLLFRYVAPLAVPTNAAGADLGVILRQLFPVLAWVFAGMILLAWAVAEVHQFSDRRLLGGQRNIDDIRQLAWRDFERLVCEAYRRKGYSAEKVGSTSGDGGVDVELRVNGELTVVQCKHWRAYKVGVTTVRELLGVVVSRRAAKGIVATSGRFTREARRFAEGNPQVELVDGPELAALIANVRTVPAITKDAEPSAPPLPSPSTTDASTPVCPSCSSAMVMRTARRGAQAGSRFWGCPRYPACRGTRPE